MPMVMTADETARYLGVDSAEVVAAISAGQFPGNRIGNHWLVRADSLLAWLDGPPPRRPAAPRRRTPPPAD
jgi:excisionase family DNA binding protein